MEPKEETANLLGKIAQSWNETEFKPKVELVKNIGGDRLNNLGLEVVVGFVGFQVLQLSQSFVLIMLCMKYKPIGKLLKYKMLPPRWKPTYKGYAESADETASAALARVKDRLPFLQYFVPKRTWNKKKVGLLEVNSGYILNDLIKSH